MKKCKYYTLRIKYLLLVNTFNVRIEYELKEIEFLIHKTLNLGKE